MAFTLDLNQKAPDFNLPGVDGTTAPDSHNSVRVESGDKARNSGCRLHVSRGGTIPEDPNQQILQGVPDGSDETTTLHIASVNKEHSPGTKFG